MQSARPAGNCDALLLHPNTALTRLLLATAVMRKEGMLGHDYAHLHLTRVCKALHQPFKPQQIVWAVLVQGLVPIVYANAGCQPPDQLLQYQTGLNLHLSVQPHLHHQSQVKSCPFQEALHHLSLFLFLSRYHCRPQLPACLLTQAHC